MRKKILVAALGLVIFAGAAQAATTEGLQAVAPAPHTAATGFFPLWYQDKQNLTLDLCLSKAVSPDPAAAGGLLCNLLPNPGVFDPALPIVFPVNFPDEAFYFMADAVVNGSGMSLTYAAHLEAAFLSGLPAPGDQITFARIRVRADFDLTVPTPGTYTVTHPYGVENFNIPTPGRRVINLTRDIGIAPLFTGALAGDIGPFLRRSATEGGTPSDFITAVNPDTGLTDQFIGDPNVPQFATGSPFGTNYVRIQRTADGGGNTTTTPDASSNQFFLQGRVWNGQRPTNVAVERASYGRTPAGAVTIDSFANTPDSTTASVCFRETLDLVVGGSDPSCLIPMTGDGAGKFYGQDPAAPALPPYIVVTATDQNAATPTTPTPIAQALSDVVKVRKAQYTNGTLTIEATSSDKAVPPKMTAVGLGVLTPGSCAIGLQRLNLVLTGEPPAFVTLVSSGGGRKTEPVTVGTAAAGGANTPPVAANDTATTPEDTPVTIAVLANDTDAECDVLSVTGVSSAVNGTATVNANGTVTFTPALNFNGTASFDYAISDGNGGTASASVTVTVTAVNDAPVAVNDTATTAEDTPLSISHATLLANDTDVDNVSPTPANDGLTIANFNVQGLAGTLSLGDPLTFTPNLNFSGTTSFSYQVRDPSGALSNFATVTITVGAANDAPVANNDTANTASGTPVTISVLANDTDVDNAQNTLTVANVGTLVGGTAVVNTNNTVTYTPNAGFTGQGSFTYQAQDPGGALSNTATVTVTVAAGPAVDLDIDRFTVPGNVRRPATITPQIRVRNNGTVNQPRNARIRGVTQTGAVFYDVTQPVSDPVGGGTTTFNFPTSQSTTVAGVGTITWTAEVFDDNPDPDSVTATTTVR